MSLSSLDFLSFLKKSPTVFHAAEEIIDRLKQSGFSPLREEDKWRLRPGEGYFIERGGSLVAAFRMPKKEITSAMILATHIDSPCLKLKPNPLLFKEQIGQLNSEVYGAPLLHTWLDRDLAISGKVTYRTKKDKIESKTIHLTDYPVIIPSLAIHLDRSIGEKGILVHKQDHLKAYFSLNGNQNDLLTAIQKHTKEKKLISFDLFLTPLEEPSLIGFHREMVAAYRLDNLTSAYAACRAMSRSKPSEHMLSVAFFWDHEEIGSISSRGADSIFATELFERIAIATRMEKEDLYRMKAKSLCLSSDLSHGYHPNFSEKYDPQNAPLLGKGVVLKFNANQKYATEQKGAAAILLLAEKHNLQIQNFASRSDIPSGSTVGSMMAAMTGIATVDLGISAWAMHSIRETISLQDEMDLCTLFEKALIEGEL